MPKLTEGDIAPPFRLPDHEGELRELEGFLGQPLILYFYPGDFTPFCTREACSFQEALEDFEAAKLHIVGISNDPPEKHAAFQEAHGLGFPLLSDEEGEVIEAYGASGLFGTRRITLVLDAGGTIRKVIKSPLPGTHVKKAIAAMEEMHA